VTILGAGSRSWGRRSGPDEAVFEARRCLSCGNCIECDGCLGACPEDAVIKLGPGRRYRFDYDRCTGCRACFEQCPVHSIEMVPEAAPDPHYAFVAPPDSTLEVRDARHR
jgi:Pyruvate/2-oxoacid:ferredoxin oxidoreductase delta subunit